MNAGKKWPPHTHGQQHMHCQRPTRPYVPSVLQPKAAAPQLRKTLPPYRLQPVPKCLQPKAATPQLPFPGRGSAPPAYRPQPAPKVLQRKAAVPTAAPAAYRPQPVPKVLQRKAAANEPPLADGSSRLHNAPQSYRPGPTPLRSTVTSTAQLKAARPSHNTQKRQDGDARRTPVANVSSAAPRPGQKAIPSARGTIQRTLNFVGIEGSTLSTAISIYHEIEQQDLSQGEFNILKNERQRFMPLLGRFSLARNTELRVTKAPKKETGDMAVTRLFCRTEDSQVYEYDGKKKQKFLEAMKAKKIRSFVVEIAFCNWRIKTEDEPFALHSVGVLLQAFTHEMSVHAEGMLDFIEDYWDYVDGKREAPPSDLPSSSEEHSKFKEYQVIRYEYMHQRVEGLPDERRRTEFIGREVSDRLTAH